MALLMTIPASEMIPSNVMKPKYERATSRPITTPIRPSGIVSRMIAGRRIELNWMTSSRMMMKAAIGSLAAIDWFASPDVSASPPSSQR